MLDRLALWGLFGAAVGRLIAKDTLLREPRNYALTRIGRLAPIAASVEGLVDPDIDWSVFDTADLAAECRNGIFPLEYGPDVTVQSFAPWWRAKTVEGLTCPSCVAWHAIFWARLVSEPRRLFSRQGIVELFAAWGAAAVITRKGETTTTTIHTQQPLMYEDDQGETV